MTGSNGLRAVIIGATGLVGSELVQQLIQHPQFISITVFTRRHIGVVHPKIKEQVISFDDRKSWQHLVTGDVLFSSLGTTLKVAGSKEAQYKVDYHYQFSFAESAANAGVPVYVLISAAGAGPQSLLFYPRMKGELEEAVKKLPFKSLNIIRPGLLVGNRKEKRVGERFAETALHFLNGIGVLKKQKPVHASIVAKAMINAALQQLKGIHTYELLQVFDLAEQR